MCFENMKVITFTNSEFIEIVPEELTDRRSFYVFRNTGRLIDIEKNYDLGNTTIHGGSIGELFSMFFIGHQVYKKYYSSAIFTFIEDRNDSIHYKLFNQTAKILNVSINTMVDEVGRMYNILLEENPELLV